MQFLINIIFIVVLLVGGNILVTWAFNMIDKYNSKQVEKIHFNIHYFLGMQSFSMLIGYLERVLLAIILVSEHYQMLAVYVTLKSIVRFPEINKDGGHLTSEKFICGTMINVLFVLFIIWYYRFV